MLNGYDVCPKWHKKTLNYNDACFNKALTNVDMTLVQLKPLQIIHEYYIITKTAFTAINLTAATIKVQVANTQGDSHDLTDTTAETYMGPATMESQTLSKNIRCNIDLTGANAEDLLTGQAVIYYLISNLDEV